MLSSSSRRTYSSEVRLSPYCLCMARCLLTWLFFVFLIVLELASQKEKGWGVAGCECADRGPPAKSSANEYDWGFFLATIPPNPIPRVWCVAKSWLRSVEDLSRIEDL
ncbi:hypothetical protein RRG08_063915 [Elysia crispata]|uniref:Uncharacterized protein n=1 Tax=Elysia crispata TaxID=231223 RepID=A0AAE0YG69_9GAST|nr:hypothetical protein RRG08_063915 [Elysia crispata]